MSEQFAENVKTPTPAPLRTETLTFGIDHHARTIDVQRPPTWQDTGFETLEAFQAWAAEKSAGFVAAVVARGV